MIPITAFYCLSFPITAARAQAVGGEGAAAARGSLGWLPGAVSKALTPHQGFRQGGSVLPHSLTAEPPMSTPLYPRVRLSSWGN